MLEPLDLHARRALLDHEGLDRGAALRLVEGRPDDDRVAAAAGGDEDLLAVDHVVVAVEDGGRRDGGGVGAEARLGDRHRRPQLVEALELLVVRDRRDRGVAEALPRHRQHHRDVAPAGLHDRQHAGHVACRCGCPSAFLLRRTPRAPVLVSPDAFMPSISEASMSSSLGYSCSARSYLREIGRKISVDTWCAWLISMPNFFGVSRLMRHTSTTPSMTPAARRSRYQRSTGCSFT